MVSIQMLIGINLSNKFIVEEIESIPTLVFNQASSPYRSFSMVGLV
jgi:hypothetical protein